MIEDDDSSRRHDDLEARLTRSVESAGARPDQWEASVRGGEGTRVSGRRVMIEGATVEVAMALWDALELPVDAELCLLIDAADQAGAPLIAGWDLGSAEPRAKLYVNASDLASDVRQAISRRLASRVHGPPDGWAGLGALSDAPHLVAVNAARGRVERKAYVQGALLRGASLGEHARWLDDLAVTREVAAGAVQSWDLDGRGVPHARAYFVAVRGRARAAEGLLTALPGWSEPAVARALPFARGDCRSVGVDLRRDRLRWTAYFKPEGAGVPLWSIEPVARYRAGAFEVAVFVEPTEHAERAFARTARHAISFRGERDVPPAVLRPLMRWVVDRVRHAEQSTVTDLGAALVQPPAPWRTSPPSPR